MEPTREDPIVGVGWPALNVGNNVVDFAPGSRYVAAGDDASAVTKDDRTALPPGEAPVGDPEPENAAFIIQDDLLGAAGADHLLDRLQGSWGVNASM